MPSNVSGVTGTGAERSISGADVLNEIRQRQTERLRAAQAETSTPTEVVEEAGKTETTRDDPERPSSPSYRVNLNPDTGRLTTEVLDRVTGDVILRIPPEYAGAPRERKGTDET